MTKLFKYTLSIVALCGALASCSDETTSGGNANNNDGKELIALSGNDNGVTRAAFTRGGFSAATTVEMRIKAKDISGTYADARYAKATATASATTGNDLSSLTYAGGMARYWDDAFGRNSQLTIYAFAIPGKTDATLLPTWSSDGWTAVDASTNPNWYTGTEYTTVTWGVKTVQTAATMLEDDLTYSNNIKEGGLGGRYTYTYNTSSSSWDQTDGFANGPLTWTAKAKGETTGKFDKGHLVFNHALAWIEINLKESNGYDTSSAGDFQWTNTATGQNITLKGFNTSGKFNVATATWSNMTSDVDITNINENAVTAAARQLYAYVLPGTNLYTTTANVVEFELDNSKYYVTGSQIANAIRTYYTSGAGKSTDNASIYQNFTTIEAGKHYIINLNVAKKGIEKITAAIVDWETVNSNDATAQNTYSKFNLKNDRGTALTQTQESHFNLYRSAQTAKNYIDGEEDKNYAWETGYGAAASKNYESSSWKTDWYWENNLTYYHFRAAGATEGTSVTINTETITDTDNKTTNVDYFNIKSGALSGSEYKDYIWGAPFVATTGTLTYDANDDTQKGFDGTNSTHQLSQAIGPTTSDINMLLFHVTSQITVNVKTTTGADKVTLYDANNTTSPKTKVDILYFLPDGKVLMGNGFVAASGNRTSAEMTTGTCVSENGTVGAYVPCTYGIVPQSLSYTGGTIGLRITTPDGNQYVVSDLSKCTASVSTTSLANPYTASSTTTGSYVIDAWYPGYQYTYNITIKKTGIERITAAVVGWETVEGDNIDIDLEN
ncbi:MAG: fimbrillin family protein [Prevotella sp.]|nr:fimbrillin family protein [Prevotella sp.]